MKFNDLPTEIVLDIISYIPSNKPSLRCIFRDIPYNPIRARGDLTQSFINDHQTIDSIYLDREHTIVYIPPHIDLVEYGNDTKEAVVYTGSATVMGVDNTSPRKHVKDCMYPVKSSVAISICCLLTVAPVIILAGLMFLPLCLVNEPTCFTAGNIISYLYYGGLACIGLMILCCCTCFAMLPVSFYCGKSIPFINYAIVRSYYYCRYHT